MPRPASVFLLVMVLLMSASNALRVRAGANDATSLFVTRQQLESDPASPDLDADIPTSLIPDKNITVPHFNNTISSGDDIAWGQGGLSDTSSDTSSADTSSSTSSDGPSESPKNSTSIEESAEVETRQVGTSAFLFVSVPLIALAAALASKYGKSMSKKEEKHISRDLEDNYSTHRMITAASEEEERDSHSPDQDDRDEEDRAFVEGEHGRSDELDRKLFVQVYKPQRDQSELTAIKNGLAMALNDRGSPAIRGSGRYNLTGRSSYTPDDVSEHNSPFDEPSMPI